MKMHLTLFIASQVLNCNYLMLHRLPEKKEGGGKGEERGKKKKAEKQPTNQNKQQQQPNNTSYKQNEKIYVICIIWNRENYSM